MDASDSLCILISTMLHFSNCICFLHIINILFSFSLQVHHLNRKAFSSAIPTHFKDILQARDKILNWYRTAQPPASGGAVSLCTGTVSASLASRRHESSESPLGPSPPSLVWGWAGSSCSGDGARIRHTKAAMAAGSFCSWKNLSLTLTARVSSPQRMEAALKTMHQIY